MKKLLIVFVFVFLVIFPTVANAQNTTPSINPTPTPTPVKYQLAYPGMLPDSPFYKLKVLRDKIILALIQDPVKKEEYHLLLADKQLQASKLLVDKGKMALAKDTALKGENEYTLILFLIKDVAKKPTKEFYDTLQAAALKHQEILNGIVAKISGDDKKTFETVLYFSKKNSEELTTIYNTY